MELFKINTLSSTVVPAMCGHPWDQAKVSVHDRWPLIRGKGWVGLRQTHYTMHNSIRPMQHHQIVNTSTGVLCMVSLGYLKINAITMYSMLYTHILLYIKQLFTEEVCNALLLISSCQPAAVLLDHCLHDDNAVDQSTQHLHSLGQTQNSSLRRHCMKKLEQNYAISKTKVMEAFR